MSDFAGGLSGLSSSEALSAIQRENRRLLGDRVKHKTILSRVSSFYGLYKHHIKQMIKMDWMSLVLLEFAFGVVLSLMIFGFMSFGLYTFNQNTNPVVVSSHLAVNGLLFILKCVLIIAIKHREERIRLSVKRSLQTLIYQKLFHTDCYYLAAADNNLIFKLLYSKFEDYLSYKVCFSGIIPLLTILTVFIISILIQRNAAAVILLCIILVRIAFGMFLEQRKHKHKNVYFEVLSQQRVLLTEFLKSYKGINLNNLKPLFLNRLQSLKDDKLYCLVHIQAYRFFSSAPSNILLFLIMLAVPSMFSFGYEDVKQFTSLTGDSSQKSINIYYSVVLGIVVMEHHLTRSLRFFIGYMAQRSSQPMFDAFFDNDFTNETCCSSNQSSASEKGEIIFKDCEVLERDKESINLSLNSLLHNEGATFNLGWYNEDPRVAKKKSLKKQITNQDTIAKPDNQLSNQRHGKFEVLLSKLSLVIRPGSKVCIFQNENSQAIRGFFDIILGEAYLNSGQLSVKGRVAYFNPKKIHLLSGKTIRDNILFGEDFNQERYDRILKIFNAQFGNYQGQDFHEVAEAGTNLKLKDLETILFARCLYQEADIYIIEEYFSDAKVAVEMAHIITVIKNTLSQKTAIFTSNNLKIIELSDTVITFESREVHHIDSKEVFLQSLETYRRQDSAYQFTKSVLEKQRSNARVEILRNRLKNSIFFKHITFEEELEIYKKLEKHRKQIEQMKSTQKSIFEFLTYGIYLTQKRRSAGKFIHEIDTVHIDTLSKLFQQLRCNKRLLARLLLLLSIQLISTSCFLMAEMHYFKFCSFVQSQNTDSTSRPPKVPYLVEMICWLAASVVSGSAYAFVAQMFTWRATAEMNQLVLQSIFESRISTILRKKYHSILDKATKDLMDIEFNLPHHLIQICSILCTVLANSLVVLYTTSLTSSLVIIGIPVLFEDRRLELSVTEFDRRLQNSR